MVSRKKRMKASDTRLFKELYSVDTGEKGLTRVLSSVIHITYIGVHNKVLHVDIFQEIAR